MRLTRARSQALLLVALAAGCPDAPPAQAPPPGAAPASAADPAPAAALVRAPPEVPGPAELAAAHCGTCHVMPQPAELQRSAWELVLPEMAVRAGHLERVAPGTRREEGLRVLAGRLAAVGLLPETPTVPWATWEAIAGWYLGEAPAGPPARPPKPALRTELPRFRARILVTRADVVAATLVRIDEARQRIFVGDAASLSILELDPTGQLMAKTPVSSPPVRMSFTPNGALVTLLGSLQPEDRTTASIVAIGRVPGDALAYETVPVLGGLPRLTDVGLGDLDGDGGTDLVTCGFGDMVGAFAWHRQLPTGAFETHVLRAEPGAIRTAVVDLTGDGRLDLLLLHAQAREGLTAFINAADAQGGVSFEPRTLVTSSPLYGYTSLALADFDGDGVVDVVTGNGDNGDIATRPVKPSAGVRVLQGRPGPAFEERTFYPMLGVSGVAAADFDQDGDIDIAAVAHDPDPEARPLESFVYLESDGAAKPWAFSPATVPLTDGRRWTTLDVGDVDGDGDLDMVLGAVGTLVDSKHPASVLLLINTTKTPAPSAP